MQEWCDWSLSDTSYLVYRANWAHYSCPYVPIKTQQGREQQL